MKLNLCGKIVESVWKEIPLHFTGIKNDVFIVMPNHVHGIISIGQAGLKPAPTKNYHLSEIVRAFKTFSSRRINQIRNSVGIPVWQRDYYDHIIRDESEYGQIGEYILYNAAKWETDQDNPLTINKSVTLPFEYERMERIK
jgi:putative transposase